jgi:hypothetical protein
VGWRPDGQCLAPTTAAADDRLRNVTQEVVLAVPLNHDSSMIHYQSYQHGYGGRPRLTGANAQVR